MSRGETTRIGDPDGSGDATRRKAVELGVLSAEDAAVAYRDYCTTGYDMEFDAFLVSQEWITSSELALLNGDADRTQLDFSEDEPSDEDDPLVGKVFSGCNVVRKLGQGGMGSVYLATKGDQEVVIKFLAAEQANNTTWRARFVREAELLRRTHHPNVVEIYDVDGESEQPHIVMEYVDGAALDAVLEDDGPLVPLEAARVARDVAKALAVAHKQGVVHRDIKPANVLVSSNGTVKMLDFGLAKNVEVDDGLSLPGQVLGTPHYMAPEQWGDHAVDARCDLFSLGSTLYHLITGTLPFPGHNPQAISRRILEGDFVHPRELEPDLPVGLELVLFRMMEPDRRFRYATAELIVRDLDKVLANEPVDIPCLVAGDGTRFPLIPGASFHVGRDNSCDVVIPDASVSRQHMQIERGKTGYVGRDLGSTYGTFVGGMRVRQVVLKDGDPIKLGKVNLTFRDGGLGPMRRNSSTQRLGAGTTETQYVAPPFLQTLAENSDRRSVVYLLEQLAPDAQSARLESARKAIEIILGPELAGQVTEKVERRMRRVRSRVPMQLFSITHENLGDDPEAWLGWWDGAQASYPNQLAPATSRPRTRLVVLAGEPKQRAIHFDKRNVFTVGREEERDIALQSRSVSRLHATILRLHNRLLIRDEGSRFGTQLNDQAVRIAYLAHGDRITMGKVEMRFEVETLDPMATMTTGGAPQIDQETFLALEDLQHPSIALGLIRFLECEKAPAWMVAAAERLFDTEQETQDFVDKVLKKYTRRARKAREILPEILGSEAPDVAGYRALFDDADLTIQLLPSGWFPIRSRS